MNTTEPLATESIEICICCRKAKDVRGRWQPLGEKDLAHPHELVTTICSRCSAEKFPQFYIERKPLIKRICSIGKYLLRPLHT